MLSTKFINGALLIDNLALLIEQFDAISSFKKILKHENFIGAFF